MKYLLSSLLLTFALALGACNSATSSAEANSETKVDNNSGDSVWIISIKPYTTLTDGEETKFRVELGYKLASQDTALIGINFNDGSDVGRFSVRMSFLVFQGEKTGIYQTTATYRNWGDSGSFASMVSMSKLNDTSKLLAWAMQEIAP